MLLRKGKVFGEGGVLFTNDITAPPTGVTSVLDDTCYKFDFTTIGASKYIWVIADLDEEEWFIALSDSYDLSADLGMATYYDDPSYVLIPIAYISWDTVPSTPVFNPTKFRKLHTGGDIVVSSGSAFVHRWCVSVVTGLTLHIGPGIFTRNNHTITHAHPEIPGQVDVTLTAAGTWVVYVALASSGSPSAHQSELVPDSIGFDAASFADFYTVPVLDTFRNNAYALAHVVVVDVDGVLSVDSITQVRFSDIDDQSTITDSDVTVASPAISTLSRCAEGDKFDELTQMHDAYEEVYKNKSGVFNSSDDVFPWIYRGDMALSWLYLANGVHSGEGSCLNIVDRKLQIWNFKEGTAFEDMALYSNFASTGGVDSGITLLARKVIGGEPTLEYVSLYTIFDTLSDLITTSWWAAYGDVIELNNAIEHTKLLEFFGGNQLPVAYSNTDHDYRYWKQKTPNGITQSEQGDYQTTGSLEVGNTLYIGDSDPGGTVNGSWSDAGIVVTLPAEAATAASPQDGAITTTGGINCLKQSRFADGSGGIAYLGTAAGEAGRFENGTYTAKLGESAVAGYFEVASTCSVDLAKSDRVAGFDLAGVGSVNIGYVTGWMLDATLNLQNVKLAGANYSAQFDYNGGNPIQFHDTGNSVLAVFTDNISWAGGGSLSIFDAAYSGAALVTTRSIYVAEDVIAGIKFSCGTWGSQREGINQSGVRLSLSTGGFVNVDIVGGIICAAT
jgi:hypothetical protein